MVRNRLEIKADACQAMRAQRGTAILVGLFSVGLDVYYTYNRVSNNDRAMQQYETVRPVITGPDIFRTLAIMALIMILGLVINSAIRVSSARSFTKIYRSMHTSFSEFWRGLFRDVTRRVVAWFLIGLFTFLWSLLLIIPGIVMSVAYSMTPYILAEYPDVTAREAIEISKRITRGYKSELFIAELSFIGWILLSVLTLGILNVFFVTPYLNTTLAGYYTELRDNALLSGVLNPDEVGTSEYYQG